MPDDKKIQLNPGVVVGLGGTGHRVCARLKKLMFDDFARVLPHVRLLALDTHKEAPAGPGYHGLGLDEKMSLVEGVSTHALMGTAKDQYPHFPKALVAEIPTVLEHGAGAQRPIGRLCLLHQWYPVLSKLQAAFTAVKADMEGIRSNPDVKGIYAKAGLDGFEPSTEKLAVFVVCNLVSGTGSGSFLDLGFLIRALAKTSSMNVDLYGLFSLPPQSATSYPLYLNAAAALRELNHYQSPEVFDDSTRRFKIMGLGSSGTTVTAGFGNGVPEAPFTRVGIARPASANQAHVNALDSKTADVLFNWLGSSAGVTFQNELVNLKGRAGKPTCAFSYAAIRHPDNEAQTTQAVRAVVSDFLLDDLAGMATEGHEELHTTWKPDTTGEMNEVRQKIGLPASGNPTAKAIDGVKLQVVGRLHGKLSIKGRSLASLNPDGIVHAFLDGTGIEGTAGSALVTQLASQVSNDVEKPLREAFAGALPAMADDVLQVVDKKINELFVKGASLRQVREQFLLPLAHDCLAIATLLQGKDVALNTVSVAVAEVLNAVKDVLTKASDWVKGGGAATFRSRLTQEVSRVVEAQATAAAIRLLKGWSTGAGKQVSLSGFSVDPSSGLHQCLVLVADRLETAEAVFQTADNEFERISVSPDAMKTGGASFEKATAAYAKSVSGHRQGFLAKAGVANGVLGLAAVTASDLANAASSVAADLVTPSAPQGLDAWCQKEGISIAPADLNQAFSVEVDASVADREGLPLGIALTVSCHNPPGLGSTVLTSLLETSQHSKHVPAAPGSGFRLVGARGWYSIPCVSQIEQVYSHYLSLPDSQVKLLHIVPDHRSLLRVGRHEDDVQLLYLAACALHWIEADENGAVYSYLQENAGVGTDPTRFQYCKVPDAQQDAGPVRSLLRAVNSFNDPAPETPFDMIIHGDKENAHSIAEHIRYRLLTCVAGARMTPSVRKARQQAFAALLQGLDLLQRRHENDFPQHLPKAMIVAQQGKIAEWLQSCFGTSAEVYGDAKDELQQVVDGGRSDEEIERALARWRTVVLGGSKAWDDTPQPTPHGAVDPLPVVPTPPEPTPAEDRFERAKQLLKTYGVERMLRVAIIEIARQKGMSEAIALAQSSGLPEELLDGLCDLA